MSFNDSFATTLTAASYKKCQKQLSSYATTLSFGGYAHVRATFPENENEHVSFLIYLFFLYLQP